LKGPASPGDTSGEHGLAVTPGESGERGSNGTDECQDSVRCGRGSDPFAYDSEDETDVEGGDDGRRRSNRGLAAMHGWPKEHSMRVVGEVSRGFTANGSWKLSNELVSRSVDRCRDLRYPECDAAGMMLEPGGRRTRQGRIRMLRKPFMHDLAGMVPVSVEDCQEESRPWAQGRGDEVLAAGPADVCLLDLGD